MSFNTFNRKFKPLSYDEEEVNQTIEESEYKPSLLKKTATTVGRIPFRFTDDFFNTASDLTGGVIERPDFKAEDVLFGKAKGAENVISEIGSFFMGFGLAGSVTKSKKAQQIQEGVKQAFNRIPMSAGRSVKVKRLATVLTDGAARGIIADFMIADVDREDELLERLHERIHDVYVGMAFGAGFNVLLNRFGRFVKKKYLVGKRRKVDEGLTKSIESIKTAVKEAKPAVRAVQKDLEEGKEVAQERLDEFAVNINLKLADQPSSDLAEGVENPSTEILEQLNGSPQKLKKEFAEKLDKTLEGKSKNEIESELIKDFIEAKDLPSLLLKLNLEVELGNYRIMDETTALFNKLNATRKRVNTL